MDTVERFIEVVTAIGYNCVEENGMYRVMGETGMVMFIQGANYDMDTNGYHDMSTLDKLKLHRLVDRFLKRYPYSVGGIRVGYFTRYEAEGGLVPDDTK